MDACRTGSHQPEGCTIPRRNPGVTVSRDVTTSVFPGARSPNWPRNLASAPPAPTRSGGIATASAISTRGSPAVPDCNPARSAETGTAERYFPVFRYEPKAASAERPRLPEITHPTIKPLALMQWLVRLVAPAGGTVLDPFSGTGTTLHACLREGMPGIGIKKDLAYVELCKNRLAGAVNADGSEAEG
jgi:hypothetical protein